MKLDYEASLTLDPVAGPALGKLETICRGHGFRTETLTASGRSGNYEELKWRCVRLLDDLHAASFRVRRWKIEKTMLDIDLGERPNGTGI